MISGHPAHYSEKQNKMQLPATLRRDKWDVQKKWVYGVQPITY